MDSGPAQPPAIPDRPLLTPILVLPDPCLLLLVGPAGAGKSTFARKHFRATEVLSSDFFRGLVADDEADQAASQGAFEVLHLVAARRLAGNRLTVIDATNVQAEARKPLLALARRYHFQTVALVFNLPQEVCVARGRQRADRVVEPRVVAGQWERLRQALPALHKERYREVYVLSSPEEVDAAVVRREPLPVDRRWECGPFDIIGDVHGCMDELLAILRQLGYEVSEAEGPCPVARPPAGRRALFVGDLVDRGPKVAAVLRLVMGMVAAGTALCVVGNHDDKLLRKLRGHDVRVAHGLAETLAQLQREPPDFTERVRAFLEGLVTHYVLDGGKLVVAHAGLTEELQGRVSPRVRGFALFGETTGEVDELGLPVRGNWAADCRGRAAVVYGHTPVREPVWQGRTINIDTGCVFGGRLTALCYPELELVSVPAGQAYSQSARPFLAPPAEPQTPPPA
jgi:protein phosphatase